MCATEFLTGGPNQQAWRFFSTRSLFAGRQSTKLWKRTFVQFAVKNSMNKISKCVLCSVPNLSRVVFVFRFLVTLGDYRECSVVVWSAFTGTCSPIVLASATTPSPMHKVRPCL